MSDRDDILRAVGEVSRRECGEVPPWDPALLQPKEPYAQSDRWELFAHRLTLTNGIPLHGFAALGAFLKERGCTFGYCDPQFAERLGPHVHGIELAPSFDRPRIDDYQFGITKATAAIAESGTVVLTDRDTPARLAALAPWIHVAVIAREDILPDILSGLTHLGNDPSIVWATGPSKTADIEGVLIEGVHGPGVQACCLAD